MLLDIDNVVAEVGLAMLLAIGAGLMLRSFILLNAVDPGYTSTDFNGHSGHKTVEQGAEVIVRMAELDRTGPTGTYVDENGTVLW